MLCVFAPFGVVTCVLFSRTVEHGRRLTVAHIVILVLGYVITHYGAYTIQDYLRNFSMHYAAHAIDITVP
jgi:hypothetical protein